MFKLLFRLILLVIVFAVGVIGGYLGWFNFILDNFHWIKK